ncbi:MAG: hypothetical protein ACRDTG_11130 [Pseudonocardiaceae bacterium]
MMQARTGIRPLVVGLVLMVIGLLAAPAAQAQPPVEVVHTETTAVGPYELRVSFSEWPLSAQRSLDFLFTPAGGIAGLNGTLLMRGPSGAEFRPDLQTVAQGRALVRHPRARDFWGLDIVALPEEGTWRFEFALAGPEGPGTGTLLVPVGPRPGPPAALSWTVGMAPLIAAASIGGFWWMRSRRTGSRNDPARWAWS